MQFLIYYILSWDQFAKYFPLNVPVVGGPGVQPCAKIQPHFQPLPGDEITGSYWGHLKGGGGRRQGILH